jgi:hypothetical protein
MPRQNEKGKR